MFIKSTVFPFRHSQFIRYIAGIMMLFLIACEKSEEYVPVPTYFPITTGSYRIYAVDEAIYSTGNKEPKTASWFEKEEITYSKTDSNGVSECQISYSIRTKPTDYWQKTKEYKAFVSIDKVLQNKDNELITYLVFPYSPAAKWDAFQHFSINDEDPRYGHLSYYENLDQPVQVDSLYFSTTLKVTERVDTTGVLLYRLGYKYYADGVGLVMDVQTDYDYLQNNGELVDYRVIDKGVRRIRKIIGYGLRK
ncbi:hypothetical protein [Dyadobacter fermentans]|uniref:hypothetical protein n=1 Tax=Dyadobacter fermentans TaxID=94254 RepID=UPI001CBCE4C6|nr:hypothetical protein [Dyadobacter fermentans]MBZ1357999.1 hypothetical protein [Dyadobacter fermentans]